MDYGYCWLLFQLFSLLIDFPEISALFVTKIIVPEIVDFRDNVTLSCSYDMNGHMLNSVKWYKDHMEFFRYTPLMHPVYMQFPVSGVHILDGKQYCNESNCRVDLSMLGVKSTGVYKCEVSGDTPHFKLAAREDNMTVATLPQNDPLIEDFNSMYRIDEFLSATCTSDYSSLPTRLTWYINGEQPLLGELQPMQDPSIQAHNFTLRRQRMKVHFYLQGQRFFLSSKMLELKCVAEIENYPELRRKTSQSATLSQYDNFNNQMLTLAGMTASGGAGTAHCILTRTWLISVCFVIFLLTKCLRRHS